VDKLTYASLEATLLAYVKRDYDAIPALKMMSLTQGEIGTRAEAWVKSMNSTAHHLKLEIVDGESVIGGGAAPSSVLPTRLIALTAADLTANELAARLRASNPPIIARVEEGKVLLDLRTVFTGEEAMIAAALHRIG
jgi:L-seryl-tRNA(Ser) seleniumtransferase